MENFDKVKLKSLVRNVIEFNAMIYNPTFKNALKKAFLPHDNIVITDITFTHMVNIDYYNNDDYEVYHYKISYETFVAFIDTINIYL